MILRLQIGETVILPQHPFSLNKELKIGGNANYTSPILNVADVLIARGYDATTVNLIPQKKSSQALCYFYSNKLGTFEKHWISFAEISNIFEPDPKDFELKIINGKLCSDFKVTDEVIGITKRELDKDELKDKFIYKNVVLKSANLELQKQKLHLQHYLEDKNKYTIENYHEFLPPMMTVIDIVDNKNFYNDRLDEKSGIIKRLPSKYFLKCKWFNPVKQSFSEELLPPRIVEEVYLPSVKLISLLLDKSQNNKIYTLKRNGEKSLAKIKNVVQIHHTFRVVFWDVLLQKNCSEVLNDSLEIQNTDLELKNLFEVPIEISEIDDIVVSKDEYYQIKYLDRANRVTTRIIKCIGFSEEAIFARCTLRENQERIFRKEGILMLRHANKTFRELLKAENTIINQPEGS